MCSTEAQRIELVICPPFRLLSSTIPWPLQPRLSSIFTFPTCLSVPVSMRSSRAPLLFGSSRAWSRSCHLCSPGIYWMVHALLFCPCSRYCNEKDPQSGQGPDNMRLPSVCTGHFPLAFPDQEGRNRHHRSPLFAISILSDLAVRPSPSRAQCTLTLPCLLAHPSLRLCIPPVLQSVVEAIEPSPCGPNMT